MKNLILLVTVIPSLILSQENIPSNTTLQTKNSSVNTERQSGKKSVGIAIALSSIIPGGGHYYNRKYFLGAFYTSTTTGLLITGIGFINRGKELEKNIYQNVGRADAFKLTGVIFVVSSGVEHVINIIHAGVNADKYNKGLAHFPYEKPYFKKVSIYPGYDIFNKQAGLFLSYNF